MEGNTEGRRPRMSRPPLRVHLTNLIFPSATHTAGTKSAPNSAMNSMIIDVLTAAKIMLWRLYDMGG